MKNSNSFPYQTLYLFLIIIFIKTYNIQYKILSFGIKTSHRCEQFINSFFFHDPAQVEEMYLLILRIWIIWISLQINSSPVEYLLLLGRNNFPLLKFFCISLILKENRPNFSKRHLIEQCNELGQSRLLKRCPQPLHIGTKRNTHSAAN